VWTVGQAIAAGCLRSEYRDVELTSQIVWAATHGVVALHIAKGNDTWVDWRPIEQRVEAMLRLLIRGLTSNG
jgi:hypothetical protein